MRRPWLTDRPVAHRGLHDAAAGRIENSLSAARAAAARGFPIEADVRLSADGAVVVFHDPTLDRLCGTPGRVKDTAFADLQKLRLRGTEDGIPLLQELLDTAVGRVPLFLELKTDGVSDGQLEAGVAASLVDYPGQVAVMSFDPFCVAEMGRLAPELPRGLIADRAERGHDQAGGDGSLRRFARRHLLSVPRVRPDFIAYDVRALPAPAPLLWRRLGIPLLTWTVRTGEQLATARKYTDQIIFEGFDPEAGG